MVAELTVLKIIFVNTMFVSIVISKINKQKCKLTDLQLIYRADNQIVKISILINFLFTKCTVK